MGAQSPMCTGNATACVDMLEVIELGRKTTTVDPKNYGTYSNLFNPKLLTSLSPRQKSDYKARIPGKVLRKHTNMEVDAGMLETRLVESRGAEPEASSGQSSVPDQIVRWNKPLLILSRSTRTWFVLVG